MHPSLFAGQQRRVLYRQLLHTCPHLSLVSFWVPSPATKITFRIISWLGKNITMSLNGISSACGRAFAANTSTMYLPQQPQLILPAGTTIAKLPPMDFFQIDFSANPRQRWKTFNALVTPPRFRHKLCESYWCWQRLYLWLLFVRSACQVPNITKVLSQSSPSHPICSIHYSISTATESF